MIFLSPLPPHLAFHSTCSGALHCPFSPHLFGLTLLDKWFPPLSLLSSLFAARPWDTFEHIRRKLSFLSVDALLIPGCSAWLAHWPEFLLSLNPLGRRPLGSEQPAQLYVGLCIRREPSCNLFPSCSWETCKHISSC